MAPNPLWMLTREPALDALVRELDAARLRIEAEPHLMHALRFSRRGLRAARERWSELLRDGESALHRFCDLAADALFNATSADDALVVQSVVIAELPGARERFTLIQDVSAAQLHSRTDLDLGNALLSRLRQLQDGRWVQPTLVANFVEYQPRAHNALGVQKMISRVKAEEELWNKVCDEIFDLDGLVARDKQLAPLGRFVKDVFGVKVVVGNPSDVAPVHARLVEHRWDDAALARYGVASSPSTRGVHVLESKDYLTDGKRSGWKAMKSVLRWADRTFELQVQPLANYLLEREYLTHESHVSFKLARERVRDQVAARVPLFGFYRDLLRWLLIEPDASPPLHPGVEVLLGD